MSDDDQSTWPVGQRDHAPGELISRTTRYTMQIRQDDGRWMTFEAARDREDRDEMTRIQAFRAQDAELADEKRRIVRRVVVELVDEVEGGGLGETSRDALLARNDETTKRILEEEDARKAEFTALLVRAAQSTPPISSKESEPLPEQDTTRKGDE